MTEKCTACKIEFEPKTKYIDAKDGYYHYGCWAKINKAILHPYQEEFFSRG